jgi:hypothetical protein
MLQASWQVHRLSVSCGFRPAGTGKGTSVLEMVTTFQEATGAGRGGVVGVHLLSHKFPKTEAHVWECLMTQG